MPALQKDNGYSLIELIAALIIIAVMVTIALKSLGTVTDTARMEQTRKSLSGLADAVVGNPELLSNGARTDYGYVGDVGALPPDLDALASNPGSYTTWNGPYIQRDFTLGGSADNFKTDAWGKPYSYTGLAIISSGGGTTLTRQLANSVDDLLFNRVLCSITDLDHTPPGNAYRDSIRCVLVCPDGAGALSSRILSVDPDGSVAFDSVPIGIHPLIVVFTPTADTLRRDISLAPGQDYFAELAYGDNYW
ncbi:MAG TPA: prepilin-type N-terminal cleavage/methylation domain-containing protein [Acidobacteriota bacterium]|nr:prepilin-type N-terminal cleavage/methylation domain-containing protein [Acidobacteriota bacterium]